MQNQLLHSVTQIKTKFFNSVEVNITRSNFNPRKLIDESDPNKIVLRDGNDPPDNWGETAENQSMSKQGEDEEDEEDDEQYSIPFKYWLMNQKNDNDEYLFHAIDDIGLDRHAFTEKRN